MKKSILSLAVSAFAVVSLHAADAAKAAADKDGACCEGKACSNGAKSACAKGMPSKIALMSPKAAAAAGVDNLGSGASAKIKETSKS